MRVCMTLAEYDFPPDVRVEKEAIRLLEDGHEIFLVCRNLTNRLPSEVWRGIQIVRINRVGKPFHYLDFIIRFVLHFNFQWYLNLKRLAQTHHFDAFHVHDLPLAGTVLRLAKRMGVPIVVDLHENYPVALPLLRKPPRNTVERWMHSVFYGVKQWKRYERTVLNQVNRLVVVVEEEAARIQQLGVPVQKITVVGNTLDVPSFDSLSLQPSILERYSGDFVVSYIGSVASYRRIDTLVRAMPLVRSAIPNARLVLVGDISGYPEYKDLVADLGLAQVVEFEGWQPIELLPSYLAASDVGVLPQERNEQTDNSMPHKLFQYLYMQRPMIVSDCLSLKRMVEETGGGIVVKGAATNPQALAQAIISLESESVRRQLGERGRQAVIDKYNWEVDAARLSKMYRGLETEVEARRDSR